MMEAETEVLLPQAKNSQGLLEAAEAKRRQETNSLPKPSERALLH